MFDYGRMGRPLSKILDTPLNWATIFLKEQTGTFVNRKKFVPKMLYSLKKKALHFKLVSVFLIFVPKKRCSLKKKKKGSSL